MQEVVFRIQKCARTSAAARRNTTRAVSCIPKKTLAVTDAMVFSPSSPPRYVPCPPPNQPSYFARCSRPEAIIMENNLYCSDSSLLPSRTHGQQRQLLYCATSADQGSRAQRRTNVILATWELRCLFVSVLGEILVVLSHFMTIWPVMRRTRGLVQSVSLYGC